jgi:hypothetical protein
MVIVALVIDITMVSYVYYLQWWQHMVTQLMGLMRAWRRGHPDDVANINKLADGFTVCHQEICRQVGVNADFAKSHDLLHVAEDVERFGSSRNYSTGIPVVYCWYTVGISGVYCWYTVGMSALLVFPSMCRDVRNVAQEDEEAFQGHGTSTGNDAPGPPEKDRDGRVHEVEGT